MPTLSVIINTKNSGKYLRRCLESVASLADEIVLVDMASTDDTLTIAAEFDKVKVFQYPDPEVGFADPAREFAFKRATGDWFFLLDSDEQIGEELAAAIRQTVNGAPPAGIEMADCYYLPRRNIIFDRALTDVGWYPDYQLRLWRTGKITWRPTVHSQPEIHGTVAYFPAGGTYDIVHHNYQSVDQFISRSQKYATFGAEAYRQQNPEAKIGVRELWQSFWSEWWRRGFACHGLAEGSHGVTLSLLQAANELQTMAKVWEAQGFPVEQLSARQWSRIYRVWRQEAAYWWADLMVDRSSGLAQWWWRLRRKWRI